MAWKRLQIHSTLGDSGKPELRLLFDGARYQSTSFLLHCSCYSPSYPGRRIFLIFLPANACIPAPPLPPARSPASASERWAAALSVESLKPMRRLVRILCRTAPLRAKPAQLVTAGSSFNCTLTGAAKAGTPDQGIFARGRGLNVLPPACLLVNISRTFSKPCSCGGNWGRAQEKTGQEIWFCASSVSNISVQPG